MSTLRKYPKLMPPRRRSWFTIDRGLLAGVVGLVGFGGLQMTSVNVAQNTPAPGASPVMTAARPVADYTPVGSIERPNSVFDDNKDQTEKRLSAPFGLRTQR